VMAVMAAKPAGGAAATLWRHACGPRLPQLNAGPWDVTIEAARRSIPV